MTVKILARVKDAPRVTQRAVHVFAAQEPQEGTVTSYCLRIIAVDNLEIVEMGVGMPCMACLMVAPEDTSEQVTSGNDTREPGDDESTGQRSIERARP